jgi:hypothetical protein
VEEQAGAYGDPVLSAFDLDFFDGEQRLRTRLGDGTLGRSNTARSPAD